ncbi:MAG: hypothetical protein QM662_11170 [Gordonia sp. (in: high G+C Gram-positive bacteria)]
MLDIAASGKSGLEVANEVTLDRTQFTLGHGGTEKSDLGDLGSPLAVVSTHPGAEIKGFADVVGVVVENEQIQPRLSRGAAPADL